MDRLGVMRRMRDITLATLNEMLEKAEDPIQLIDQYLSEKMEQLRELEKLSRQMNQHTRMLRDQFLNAEKWRQKREEQALLALKAGEEEVARLVVEEKLQYEEQSRKYRDLYNESRASVEEVDQLLEQVRREIQEVAGKRQIYMARLETLRLKQRMNQHLRQFGGTRGPERGFERLEEKLQEMESEAAALWELRRSRGKEEFSFRGFGAIDEVSNRWERSIESLGSRVDEELENLKKKLGEGGREG
ncbi:PspA/IM30 family protein [Thermicanus aegyptius]|uniref:PspA/IM30 family protein n=1 Tax=Thermicanus aegyptius TaxID=94009 RepID=UPI0009FBB00D|nr:PspA/IM30 family protein [Thermicanus aegyptius]